jgi:hypothetical protein
VPDPSTPISDEAVEATAKAIWEADIRYIPTEHYRPGTTAWDYCGTKDYERNKARAALEAAAPFMEGHALYRSQRAKTAAAEAKAATLAGLLRKAANPHAKNCLWDRRYLTTTDVCTCGVYAALGSTETREGE